MKLQMKFKEYRDEMKELENQPFSFDIAMKPFGIASIVPASEFLLIGHILDLMAEELKDDTIIDAIDVAQAAHELDYTPANNFLDQAPWLIIQMAKAMVA